MWRGAKTAQEESISNAAFLRTRIEWIGSFFSENEIAEIWVTFPDPQLKERRAKKRLTASYFLNTYNKIIKPGGKVHLKTDSRELYDYTRKILLYNSSEISEDISDLYSLERISPILLVKTHYEKIFLKEGKKITYLQFSLDKNTQYAEPLLYDVPDEEGGE
jgi:tRNA (guanine-N7-)-methyltransferase